MKSVEQLKSDLHAAIRKRDFAPAADFVTQHAQPCIRFRDLGGFDEAPIGATRLGGDPDLPPDLDWPTDPNAPTDSNALLFVAQLNLAELPLWEGCVLPESGLLSIFVGIGGLQGFSTAFHFPAGAALNRHATPIDRLGPEFRSECYLKPCRPDPVLALSVPATVEHFQKGIVEHCSDLDWLDPEYPEIDDDLRAFDEQVGPDEWISQLLGYAVPPYLPQNNYHEQASAKHLGIDAIGRHGVYDADILSSEDLTRIATESLKIPSLLNMDSGGSTGAMWSDCGTLHVLAHEDQLRHLETERLPMFVYH